MHLHVIICFALLIWWPDQRPFAPLVASPLATCMLTWAQVPSFFLAASWASAVALGRLHRRPVGPIQAQAFYHKATFLLRLTAVLAFVATVGLANWAALVRSVAPLAAVPGAADLVILSPFLAACTAIFVGLYPIDRAIHQVIVDARAADGQTATAKVWNRRQYLNFNLRHHLLVVAVPMTLILIAFDLARDHEELLVRLLHVPWAVEAVPGLAAGLVFVVAPTILRRIWTTTPLPDGPLRRELERICERIGLRYRNILVWHSGGMMVNAAVMGLFRQVRYVMLSDGLLEAMTPGQIQAVFGHEAGHVRHRHIQFFLLFAVCSMLLLSGLVEALRLGVERQFFSLSPMGMQALGLVAAVLFWVLGFGWLSRRFERQADVFGTYCVTEPGSRRCTLPCSIHGHEPGYTAAESAVCATAAEVFVSALRRVAMLNGIPQEERSWRHSSIASRIRFLVSLAGDPRRARRFDHLIRSMKRAIWVVAAAGLVFAALYVWDHPVYGVRALPPAGADTLTPAAPAPPGVGATRHRIANARPHN